MPKKMTAAKKTAAPKKVVKAAPKKVAEAKKVAGATTHLPKNVKYETALTKAAMHKVIADATDLTPKKVSAVFDCLGEIIHGHLRSKAAGVCSIGGLMKVEIKRKPAIKARKGINPFTREEMVFKAKPARNVVKVKALKRLKGMVD